MGASAVIRSGQDKALRAFVNSIGASWLIPTFGRKVLLRLYGVKVGRRVTINPRCMFGGRDISIGRGSYLNVGVSLDNMAPITIGANVLIGMGTMVFTSDHVRGPLERRGLETTAAPVVIQDGCLIGAGTVILPGVTIGAGAVVGACSLVTRDLPAGGTYVGSPARAV